MQRCCVLLPHRVTSLQSHGRCLVLQLCLASVRGSDTIHCSVGCSVGEDLKLTSVVRCAQRQCPYCPSYGREVSAFTLLIQSDGAVQLCSSAVNPARGVRPHVAYTREPVGVCDGARSQIQLPTVGRYSDTRILAWVGYPDTAGELLAISPISSILLSTLSPPFPASMTTHCSLPQAAHVMAAAACTLCTSLMYST